MKLPHLKYNAAEIASLTVLLAVAAILAAVLLARSCTASTAGDEVQSRAAADSIATAIDHSDKSPAIDTNKPKKAKNKKVKRTAADRQPASRDYLDEPVNE